MKAFFRTAAPVRVSRTGWPAAWTSMAAGNRALLPSTPTVSPAVAAPKATATVRAAISDRVRGKCGIVPPVGERVSGGPRARSDMPGAAPWCNPKVGPEATATNSVVVVDDDPVRADPPAAFQGAVGYALRVATTQVATPASWTPAAVVMNLTALARAGHVAA